MTEGLCDQEMPCIFVTVRFAKFSEVLFINLKKKRFRSYAFGLLWVTLSPFPFKLHRLCSHIHSTLFSDIHKNISFSGL
jgi:hypothetical protein